MPALLDRYQDAPSATRALIHAAMDTRRLGDRHVVEVTQRPDGGPLAVLNWATAELDPGVTMARLHLGAPETGAVQDLGQVGVGAQSPVWWNHDGEWHLGSVSLVSFESR
ncbi:hypothetical protein [Streptomyces echinatus]|uniref:Uncharacterized protein n=1 Tax=Streptomyces echinatus TaxID=67293 RepID=A0A7W9PSB1_9ACTN|nr:hypothetical protein [Streptomyces echinatus]MBB5926352.1 hypothetical protein [Streptomyces echinatus]